MFQRHSNQHGLKRERSETRAHDKYIIIIIIIIIILIIISIIIIISTSREERSTGSAFNMTFNITTCGCFNVSIQQSCQRCYHHHHQQQQQHRHHHQQQQQHHLLPDLTTTQTDCDVIVSSTRQNIPVGVDQGDFPMAAEHVEAHAVQISDRNAATAYTDATLKHKKCDLN